MLSCFVYPKMLLLSLCRSFMCELGFLDTLNRLYLICMDAKRTESTRWFLFTRFQHFYVSFGLSLSHSLSPHSLRCIEFLSKLKQKLTSVPTKQALINVRRQKKMRRKEQRRKLSFRWFDKFFWPLSSFLFHCFFFFLFLRPDAVGSIAMLRMYA